MEKLKELFATRINLTAEGWERMARHLEAQPNEAMKRHACLRWDVASICEHHKPELKELLGILLEMWVVNTGIAPEEMEREFAKAIASLAVARITAEHMENQSRTIH